MIHTNIATVQFLYDANASSDQDLANSSQVQDGVPNLSSTPIVHKGQNRVKDAFQRLNMTSRSCDGYKETKAAPGNNTKPLERGTDSRSQTRALFDDQQILLILLSADPYYLDPYQGWYVIFAHGPNHQGPRISLIDHVAS